MTPLGDPRTHYWLVLRTARACDLDLAAAMQQGRMDQADWAGMVNRCRACPAPGACAHRLDQAEATAAPPPYCRNAERFAALTAR